MSDLIVYDIEQGTPEWFAARRGIPTASEFGTVLAKGRGGGESITRRRYLLTLAGEIITGQLADAWEGNRHTERGKLLEPEARRLYALLADVEPVQVGFCRRDRAGASPDSFIGQDGLLEIKTKLPHLQLDVLERDEVPPEHIPQIQGQLWITGRAWCDFLSYWPGLRPFVRRVHRDEDYIARLAVAVAEFNEEVDRVVDRFGLRDAA